MSLSLAYASLRSAHKLLALQNVRFALAFQVRLRFEADAETLLFELQTHLFGLLGEQRLVTCLGGQGCLGDGAGNGGIELPPQICALSRNRGPLGGGLTLKVQHGLLSSTGDGAHDCFVALAGHSGNDLGLPLGIGGERRHHVFHLASGNRPRHGGNAIVSAGSHPRERGNKFVETGCCRRRGRFSDDAAGSHPRGGIDCEGAEGSQHTGRPQRNGRWAIEVGNTPSVRKPREGLCRKVCGLRLGAFHHDFFKVTRKRIGPARGGRGLRRRGGQGRPAD
jgi:hypothetical protein